MMSRQRQCYPPPRPPTIIVINGQPQVQGQQIQQPYQAGAPMMSPQGQPMMSPQGQPMNFPQGEPMLDPMGQPRMDAMGVPLLRFPILDQMGMPVRFRER